MQHFTDCKLWTEGGILILQVLKWEEEKLHHEINAIQCMCGLKFYGQYKIHEFGL